MMPPAASPVQRLAALLLMPLLVASPCWAWGSDGHRLINRIAIEKLPADMPAFLRSPAAVEEIEYLGPEPDRWRSPAEPELSAAQAPEHFIDLELADIAGPLPRWRFDYIAALYAAGLEHPEQARALRPEKVGLQPYVTVEVYERLKAAMREYRSEIGAGSGTGSGASAVARQDTRPVEQAITFYAGWLGHYAADASNPLHTTVNYDGWVEKNPKGYSSEHGIHAQFESTFVAANVKAADVAPLVGAPHALTDVFDDYVAFLRHSNGMVPRLYDLQKEGGFAGAGSQQSRQFVDERLAAGATMLRDLIYTAWVESARPVPERPASH